MSDPARFELKIDLHIHDESSPAVERKLDQIVRMLNLSAIREKSSARREIQMAVDLSQLQAAVSRNTDVDQSAIVLLQGLKAKIDELIANSGNTVDPAALQALSDALGGSTQSLADAVTANTPAA